MRVITDSRLRRVISLCVPYVLMPALIFISLLTGKYAVTALLAVLLSLLLFMAGYDRKRVGTRRLVLTVIMTALSVVGRFIPLIKPVTAFTILSGMYLGSEAGFLTGALSAFLSNFYFGQGPWTPFQMFAWGMIGLIAGVLGGTFLKSPFVLYLYGFLSGALYSVVMDVWSVSMYGDGAFAARYLASLGASLPFTILYAVSNVVFLLLLQKPLGRKLTRIKKKYGV